MTVSVPEKGTVPAAMLWETVPVFLDRSMRKETALMSPRRGGDGD